MQTPLKKKLDLSSSFFAYIYILSSFGLSGIPIISRSALVAGTILIFTIVAFHIRRLYFKLWLAQLVLFYLYIICPAFALSDINFEIIGKVAAAFIGTTAIGLALQLRIVSYNIIVFGAISAAAINTIAVFSGIDTSLRPEIGRFSGLMGNPNSLSISMALTGFIVWLRSEHYNMLLRFSSIVIAIFGAYISGSRKGVILVFFLFFIALSKLYTKFNVINRLLCFFSLVIVGIIIVHYSDNIFFNRNSGIVAIERINKGLSGEDKSWNDRIKLVKKGVQLWKKSLIFGHGLNQFSKLSKYGSYAHNNYIEILATGGIIGFLLFYSLHLNILLNAGVKYRNVFIQYFLIVLSLLTIDIAVVSYYSKEILVMIVILLNGSSTGIEHNKELGKSFKG